LTEAYNRQIVGGPGLVVAGWVLAGLGLALVGSGAGFWELASHGDTVSITVTALAMWTTGTALVLASIPCLAVGYVRWRRWLPDATLDGDGPPKTRADSRRPGLSLVSISPVVTDRFVGMGATFRF